MNVSEKKCGTCKHWRKQEVTAQTLGQPAQGVCLESPPSVSAIPSPNGLMLFCNYPTLPALFQACDRHEEALKLETT